MWAAAQPPAGGEALLEEAFRHWLGREKPYPRQGGVVPPSPRAELLKAMTRLVPFTAEALCGHLGDSRPDVREVARRELIARLAASPVDRAGLVSLAAAGKVPADALRSVLEVDVDFSSEEVAVLLPLLQSADPDLRFAALPLLRSPRVAHSLRRGLLEALRDDAEPQIREAAATIGADEPAGLPPSEAVGEG